MTQTTLVLIVVWISFLSSTPRRLELVSPCRLISGAGKCYHFRTKKPANSALSIDSHICIRTWHSYSFLRVDCILAFQSSVGVNACVDKLTETDDQTRTHLLLTWLPDMFDNDERASCFILLKKHFFQTIHVVCGIMQDHNVFTHRLSDECIFCVQTWKDKQR